MMASPKRVWLHSKLIISSIFNNIVRNCIKINTFNIILPLFYMRQQFEIVSIITK